jgi:hypothetical protein
MTIILYTIGYILCYYLLRKVERSFKYYPYTYLNVIQNMIISLTLNNEVKASSMVIISINYI